MYCLLYRFFFSESVPIRETGRKVIALHSQPEKSEKEELASLRIQIQHIDKEHTFIGIR